MTLYGRASDNIELREALEQCGDILFHDFANALLYTPAWCGFAQIGPTANDWTVSDRDKRRFDEESVFEARIFSEQAELRWLKQWPDKGRAALISESDISGFFAANAGTFRSATFIDQTYLLWGEGIKDPQGELPSGWSRLATARIGTIDVPFPLDDRPPLSKKDERVQLVAREYLDVIDEHGNVAVVEERLLKLARA